MKNFSISVRKLEGDTYLFLSLNEKREDFLSVFLKECF